MDWFTALESILEDSSLTVYVLFIQYTLLSIQAVWTALFQTTAPLRSLLSWSTKDGVVVSNKFTQVHLFKIHTPL